MKKIIYGAAALALSTAPVLAGGIERANQSIGILFEEGNYAEAGIQLTRPSVSGRDVRGDTTGNVAENYSALSFGYKHEFGNGLSAALIVDQPYGADIAYPADQSTVLGGTQANVSATAITGILRYKMENNFGVHGGIAVSRASGDVWLDGAAYGGLPVPPAPGVSSYNATMESSTATGWLAGVSWERPDIAARVALTYYSHRDHDFDTTERFGSNQIDQSVTTVRTPRAINLDFQTGVAADTLVFGQIRWVKWSEFEINPRSFVGITGGGLVSLEDSTTYTLGVGRRFNENWSGSASMTYEPKGDVLVSPLAPTTGRVGVTLAGVYTQDNMKITTGINYTRLGDAQPQTRGDARAEMTGNSALSVGVRVGYR
ncbi:MAG: outer membrane protein transport protein, partial [Paracoccus sp. (in: a-proteobacteria)]|nr:outer membrane protein transport protein [Paracoccus sp. (in: a-proteobacteria)]